VIEDAYRIPFAPHTPPGIYTIEIGMYGLVDIARLPVSDAEDNLVGDAVFLAIVTVE